ncbi:MAG: PaaI family thioesterase [Hyphomicrobiales bacterium]|nr:PaaI family thioesterase [Rhodoblastus sp.]MCC2111350.1 PaaI family thioesterase [Hyphomicrobiales bacterium]
MSERDFLTEVAAVNASAAFNRWAGFEVVAAASGRVTLRMNWREEAGQYAGFLHAGLVGALIDTACGFAAFTQAGHVLASHYSVNCLAPAVGRAFVATAEVARAGKRQIFTRAELFAEDESGARKLVATGETILMTV